MRYCKSKHREFSSGLTALAIVIAASAIGGLLPAAAADDVQTYTDLAALEAAAKEEGTLNIYTAPEYDFLITGFKEAYPWATVNFTGLEPPETAAKVTAELGAGVNNVDIANLKLPQIQQFIAKDALARIVVPNDALVPDELKDPDGYTHPETSSHTALVYNTDLVKEPPAGLAELTDPKWSGEFAIDSPTGGSTGSQVLASQRTVMGDEQWKKWLQGLADNKPNITKSSSSSFDAVLRGDSAICACGYHDFTDRDPNAPLGAVFYDQNGQGIITALAVAVAMKAAPHPHMAALWLNWMESPEGGQPGFAKSGRVPVVEFPGNTVGLPAGTKVAPVWKVLGDYFKDPDSYNAVIGGILR
jgi:ABC-type Fe3+ transport system substrate-binding protein